MKKKELIGKTINNQLVIAPVDSFLCKCTKCNKLNIFNLSDIMSENIKCECEETTCKKEVKPPFYRDVNKDNKLTNNTKEKTIYPPKKDDTEDKIKEDKYIDKKFGMLKVLKKDPENKNKYICQCDCGNIKSIIGSNLTKKDPTRSCGCLRGKPKRKIKINDTFGDLKVSKIGIKVKNIQYYICKCNCGNITSVSEEDLLSGNKYNCGCQKRNLVGRTVGNLLIKSIDPEDKTKYICECKCGNLRSVKAVSLLARRVNSCGCMGRGRKPKDYKKRYGKLVVEDKYLNDSNIWIVKCRCDCGNIIETAEGNLESGSTYSCGKCNNTVLKAE